MDACQHSLLADRGRHWEREDGYALLRFPFSFSLPFDIPSISTRLHDNEFNDNNSMCIMYKASLVGWMAEEKDNTCLALGFPGHHVLGLYETNGEGSPSYLPG